MNTNEQDSGPVELDPIKRLSKDLKVSAKLLGRHEARFLVDTYYQIQEFRIASAGQVRSIMKQPEDAVDAIEPCETIQWLQSNMTALENDIKKALAAFDNEWRIGQWLQSICGIGPVITAGLLSTLDVRKCNTAGHFWRFAGLDPTMKWEKGKKRPWNARLKCLCAFKIGESFVKVQGREKDVYGKLFAERKAQETDGNVRGNYAQRAKDALAAKNFGKETEARKAYEAGHLPKAHIHARARRWTVKLFLSHVHHAMYEDYFGTAPPVPYVFSHCDGDHRHFISPPNWPWSKGGRPLTELLIDTPDAPKESNEPSVDLDASDEQDVE